MTADTTTKKKNRRGNPPGTGRPKAIIDWTRVENLIMGGSNGVQIAAELGIHPDTLYLNCEREHKTTFTAYFHEKRAKGDSKLHQMQYKRAVVDGNVQMLIKLGEHRLGQKIALSKDAQDILKAMSEFVEDSRNSKAESDKDS